MLSKQKQILNLKNQKMSALQIVVVHDPYTQGCKDGDIDDILAFIFANKLIKDNKLFSGIEYIVYIPYTVNSKGETRYDLVMEGVVKKLGNTPLKFITSSSDEEYVKETVKNALIVGLFAPISDKDSSLIDGLLNRNNNKFNFSQGVAANNDYNFSNMKVARFLKDSKLDIDLLNNLFPTQYKSSASNKTMSIDKLTNLSMDVALFKNEISLYTLMKCLCVPHPNLKFASGLFCPLNGKGNNMKVIINFLIDNNFIDNSILESVKTDFEKVVNGTETNEFFMNLVNRISATVRLTETEMNFINHWIEVHLEKHECYLIYRDYIFSSFKMIMELASILNFDLMKNEFFPSLENLEVPNTEATIKFPSPICFDLVAFIGYLYGLYIKDLNYINNNSCTLEFLSNEFNKHYDDSEKTIINLIEEFEG